MQLVQHKTLDTGRRVQRFLDAQAAVIGDRVGPTFRHQLDDAVGQLAAFHLEQAQTARTARSETSVQSAWRRDLFRGYLRPIKRIARRKLRATPEYQSLLVPATAVRRWNFLTLATAAANTATIHEQLLVDNGMPAGFLAELRDGIARLTDSTQNRVDHVTRRLTATAGLEAMEQAVRDIVSVLDDILTPVLKSDQALLGGWNAIKQVHQTVVTPVAGDNASPSGSGDTEPASAKLAV